LLFVVLTAMYLSNLYLWKSLVFLWRNTSNRFFFFIFRKCQQDDFVKKPALPRSQR